MRNNNFKIIFLIFFLSITTNVNSLEQFNFNVTEIQILEDGNKFVGKKRGVITSNNGITITADKFEYIKRTNIITTKGNVEILDKLNNFKIYADNITYKKNDNLILTSNNSKAFDLKNNIEIEADSFKYNLLKEIITAENDVVVKNIKQNYLIYSDYISYFKNKNRIYSEGKTLALLKSKYNFKSEDLHYLIDKEELFSNKNSIVTDRSNLYQMEKFNFLVEKEELKGEKILISSNYKLPESDKFYFESAVINLKNNTFLGKDPKIKIHKNVFNNIDNDPRILGVSATSNKDFTKINKGVFTSCKENTNCTPWSIKAEEIIHDKKKREIVYNNALLKIYEIPVLYFPKFFHPDPSVNRRSGFLTPKINNSNMLGNSFSIPYFSVLAANKDFTVTPFIFEDNLQMLQTEFREISKNSKIYTNFGFVNNYKSSIESDKNSIFNLFANYTLDLNIDKFFSSDLFLSIEKVTNDTFLKIFDTHIQDSILKPTDYDNLKSELKVTLISDNYKFESGIISYENLQKNKNDRYEYIFPYYNYNTTLSEDIFSGTVNFSSMGDNILDNTNRLKSNITNDITYESKEYITLKGLKSTFGVNIKNLNSVGKNNSEYKSSPQIELMSEINLNNSYPLLKQSETDITYLVPKILLKINPSDMKNYSSSDKSINVNNIFNKNRLGFIDTLETGKSLTLGIDFKKENIDDFNKYFEIKLASVLRDKKEVFIPSKSTLGQKNSNLFGSITNNFSESFNINYNFAIDNDLDKIEYNDIGAEFILNNFSTKFNFLEENGVMGNSNFLENNTSFNVDNQNYITFKTRRNRKLNLTEYYDLVYEYKNDCLIAGIKYKKSYYEDRDLKPSENIFFTISLIPITNYEQKIDR